MTTIAVILVLAVVALIGWFSKRALKKNLSAGLGRKVKDHELTSLSAWMSTGDKK